MKYIILNCQGIEVAILFPDAVTHSQAINQLQAKPISAGFCHITSGGGVSVYGVSDSLGLKSRAEDSEAIQFTLRLMGLDTSRGQTGSVRLECGGLPFSQPALSSAPESQRRSAVRCGKCGSELVECPGPTHHNGLRCPLCTGFSHHANANSFGEFGVSHHPAATNAHPSTK